MINSSEKVGVIRHIPVLKEEAIKTGLISEKDYNRIVDPKKMIYPA